MDPVYERTNAFSDGVFDHKSYTERSLSRMNKAKHKAERAARHASAAASNPNIAIDTPISGSGPVTPSADDPPATEVAPTPTEPSQAGDGDKASTTTGTDASPDRTELLRSKPQLVGHFMRLMVPILVDVYAASVITPVRIKTLGGLLKAVSFQDDTNLRRVLEVNTSIVPAECELTRC
jgi:E3 ubiquitin-protein ligase TRIP12